MTLEPCVGMRDRFVGCLVGGAIGDALGAAIEFDALGEIRRGHGRVGITGFVPAYGRLGAITDDTQMTLFTAEGLLRARASSARDTAGVLDAVAHAYDDWMVTQGFPGVGGTSPGWLVTKGVLHARRAPGNTCLSALRSGKRGGLDRPLNASKGCGAVMRVAPVGLAADDPFGLAVEVGALTHGHPSGYLSAGVLASVIASTARGAPLLDAIDTARHELTGWHGHEETLAAVDAALRLAHQGDPGPERVERLGRGWVGEEALAIGLYCALVAPDVRTALLLAVNHSGDSDSTGSIAGNLLGAMQGVDALPLDLLGDLEAADLVARVANDLADTFVDGRPPNPQRYPAV